VKLISRSRDNQAHRPQIDNRGGGESSGFKYLLKHRPQIDNRGGGDSCVCNSLFSLELLKTQRLTDPARRVFTERLPFSRNAAASCSQGVSLWFRDGILLLSPDGTTRGGEVARVAWRILICRCHSLQHLPAPAFGRTNSADDFFCL